MKQKKKKRLLAKNNPIKNLRILQNLLHLFLQWRLNQIININEKMYINYNEVFRQSNSKTHQF